MRLTPSEYADLVRRHPHLAPKDAVESVESHQKRSLGSGRVKVQKPLLNKTERRYFTKLVSDIGGIGGIMMQAITLRLNPPFKSYRPDLAYLDSRGHLVLVEVKAPHRFHEKGIAKAALAAKTYPQFRFELAMWTGKEWKVTVLSP